MNRNVITTRHVGCLVGWVGGKSLHAKRVESLADAVVAVVNAVSLSIHTVGAGLAQLNGLHVEHAIKQVARRLSNSALNVWALFGHWVPS